MFASSQIVKEQYQQQTVNQEYYDTEWYITWKLSNVGDWGVPSFYWGVSRSKEKTSEGYYIFDIWFYSNSYIWDYENSESKWVSTYVEGIYVACNGTYVNSQPVWVTFREAYAYEGLRFYLKQHNPDIRLLWSKLAIP